jgi:hypothetical protein
MKEIKYKRRKIWKKEETNQKFSIIWIIEFYSKEQIKNDINKNIFISISLGGYVIIYSLNISMDSNNNPEELLKVIKMKRVSFFHPQKIVKLKSFNSSFNKNEENNYFLLCFPNHDMALIINVTKNFQSIITVQKIKICKGLHYSVEFNYDGYNYLLNIIKNEFFLWYYNEKTKIIKIK